MLSSRCRPQQQDRRRVEHARDDKDEPPQYALGIGADQGGEVQDGPQVGIGDLPVAVDLRLLDL
jgi:hypothetical protein